MDALFSVPEPRNETVRDYAPGSAQATSLQKRLGELAADRIDLTMTVDGAQRMAGGESISVVQPHKHAHVLGVTRNATHDDAIAAVSRREERRADVARHVVRGSGRDLPARRRHHRRPMA